MLPPPVKPQTRHGGGTLTFCSKKTPTPAYLFIMHAGRNASPRAVWGETLQDTMAMPAAMWGMLPWADIFSPFCTQDGDAEKKDPFEESGLTLSPTAAEAKEKVRAKRVKKRAPQMDWNKKREIFSNF